MRNPNTLFNQVCNFINSKPIGSTFKTRELNNAVSENMTRWKNGDYYISRLYRRHLAIAYVVSHASHGVWRVEAHIPDFVSVPMLEANRGAKAHIFNKQTQTWKSVPRSKTPWNAKMKNHPLDKTAAPFEIEKDVNLSKTGNSPSVLIWKLTENNKIEEYSISENLLNATLSIGNYVTSLEQAEQCQSILNVTETTHLDNTDLDEFNDEEDFAPDNLIGKEVYWLENDEFLKGEIVEYDVKFSKHSAPESSDIKIELAPNDKYRPGSTCTFDKITDVSLSKELFLEKLKNKINHL